MNTTIVTRAFCLVAALVALPFTSAKATVIDLSGFNNSFTGQNGPYGFSGDGGTAHISNSTAGRFLAPANSGVLTADISSLTTISNTNHTVYLGGNFGNLELGTAGDQIYGAGDITIGFNGSALGGQAGWNILTTRAIGASGENQYNGHLGSNWNIGSGNHYNNDQNTGFAIGNGDFVLGLTYNDANHADTYSLWLGANANAATQGAADFSFTSPIWGSSYIGDLTAPSLVGLNVWLPSSGSLTTSHMFASDSWHPVQAVPEPSTYGMLLFGITGLLLVARMRGARA